MTTETDLRMYMEGWGRGAGGKEPLAGRETDALYMRAYQHGLGARRGAENIERAKLGMPSVALDPATGEHSIALDPPKPRTPSIVDAAIDSFRAVRNGETRK